MGLNYPSPNTAPFFCCAFDMGPAQVLLASHEKDVLSAWHQAANKVTDGRVYACQQDTHTNTEPGLRAELRVQTAGWKRT